MVIFNELNSTEVVTSDQITLKLSILSSSCTNRTGKWGGSRTMPKLLAFDVRIICWKQNNTASCNSHAYPFSPRVRPPSWPRPHGSAGTSAYSSPWQPSVPPHRAPPRPTKQSFTGIYSKPETCTYICIIIICTHCGWNIGVMNYGITDTSRCLEHVCKIILGICTCTKKSFIKKIMKFCSP